MRGGGASCHIKGAVHNEPVLRCMMGKKRGRAPVKRPLVLSSSDRTGRRAGRRSHVGGEKQKDGRREMAEGWCAEVAGSEKRCSRRGS